MRHALIILGILAATEIAPGAQSPANAAAPADAVAKAAVLKAAVPTEAAADTASLSRDVSSLTLIKSGGGKAVVRFGTSREEVLAVGDRVGARATVVEVADGRLVLEDVSVAPDGTPVRARIVVREGETGGRRFQRHPGLAPPPGVRPDVVVAPGTTRTKRGGSQ